MIGQESCFCDKLGKKEMTSCHHGHADHQNSLKKATDVLKRHDAEIGFMEIDFVNVRDNFISSHDFSQTNIDAGSALIDWVKLVVVKHEKVLWIDLKSHHDFLGLFCCDTRFKTDCKLLFKVLSRIRKIVKRRIETHIWISCQDSDVKDQLVHFNNNSHSRNRWIVVNDIPFVGNYLQQYILPHGWLTRMMINTFREYDFGETASVLKPHPVVCIDRSFFATTQKLIDFIEDSSIPLGATVLLYTFEADQQPLHIEGYVIIMQYDYVA